MSRQIALDYRLTPRWNRNFVEDWADVGADEIEYDLLLGDIIFEIDGVDFSAPWGWIPVLGFARQVMSIIDSLRESESWNVFQYTESDAEITFRRYGNGVSIHTNYTPGKEVTVEYQLLNSAVRDFASKMLDELANDRPSLLRNRYVLDFQEDIAHGTS